MYIKNIAFIPARKNSKRIKNKNLSKVNNKTLISIVLDNIKKTKIFNEVYVASDDQKIINVARKYGSNISYLRPKKLSDDFTPVTDLVSDFCNWISKNKIICDTICLIYPTSIFIKPSIIKNSYKFFLQNNSQYLLPIKKFPHPIQRGFQLDKKSRINKIYHQYNFDVRTQDHQKTFYDAGQFCHGRFSAWKNKKKIFSKNTIGYDISGEITIDIDWPEDLKIARKLAKIL